MCRAWATRSSTSIAPGTIRTSGAIAFEVRAATSDGSPKLDLDAQRRWRGLVFNNYQAGRWSNLPVKELPRSQGVAGGAGQISGRRASCPTLARSSIF